MCWRVEYYEMKNSLVHSNPMRHHRDGKNLVFISTTPESKIYSINWIYLISIFKCLEKFKNLREEKENPLLKLPVMRIRTFTLLCVYLLEDNSWYF